MTGFIYPHDFDDDGGDDDDYDNDGNDDDDNGIDDNDDDDKMLKCRHMLIVISPVPSKKRSFAIMVSFKLLKSFFY